MLFFLYAYLFIQMIIWGCGYLPVILTMPVTLSSVGKALVIQGLDI